MTEWHVRYGGRGVMIYWHVEREVCVHLLAAETCSSSEVAAMIEGVLRHCTEMDGRAGITSTATARARWRSRSAICWASSSLPRLKGHRAAEALPPGAGSPGDYPRSRSRC